MHDVRDATAVLAGARERLLGYSNVVATGVGFKEVAGERTREIGIVCSVTRKVPLAQLSSADAVPRVIDGVSTDVIQTGSYRVLQVHRERHRPAPGGVSIGHRDVTAGTLGCVVRRGAERLILSNNHVLANTNAAEPGDPILQPGSYDGGRLPDDAIAVLERFVPIEMIEESSTCAAAQRITMALNAVARILNSRTRLRAVSWGCPCESRAVRPE